MPTTPAGPKAKATPPRRRTPRQARARATLEAILDATAQLVQQHGEAAFTTNRIAECAGVSIGTLYQYVPDKAALLDHWAARWRAQAIAQIDAAMAEALARPPAADPAAAVDPADPAAAAAAFAALVRRVVRAVLVCFATAPAHRAMLRLAWRHDAQGRIADGLRVVAERLGLQLQPWAAAQGWVVTPGQIYIATRAIVGAIRFAAIEDSPLLDSPDFEDGLTRLGLAVLRPAG